MGTEQQASGRMGWMHDIRTVDLSKTPPGEVGAYRMRSSLLNNIRFVDVHQYLKKYRCFELIRWGKGVPGEGQALPRLRTRVILNF